MSALGLWGPASLVVTLSFRASSMNVCLKAASIASWRAAVRESIKSRSACAFSGGNPATIVLISPLRKRFRDAGASRYAAELEVFQFIVDNGSVAVHFKENAVLRPVAGLEMFVVVKEGKDI